VAIGGVVINFAAKTADAVRDIGKLTRELGDLDGKADGVGSKLKKGVAIGAAAVGTAMVGAGAAMLDFAKAAAEDEAQAENLRRTLSKIPGVTEDMIDANSAWIDSMEIATSVADTDLRSAVSKLSLATGDLTRAQALTTVAVDAAAGSGKSLKTVTDALAKAAQGNTAALERQFPWLDKNKDGAVTLDEALQGLKGAYEGAAEAAADRKPWERFSAVMDQLKETIGESLLPYINRFSDWLKDKKNQQALRDFADDVVDVVDAIAGLVKILWNLIGALKGAWEWIDSVNKKWQGFLDSINRGITWPWEKGGRWPWQGGSGRAAPATAAAYAAYGPTAYTGQVMLTDEQVYRAVSSMILRGDVRNGRGALVL
jgi:hypothetical protein